MTNHVRINRLGHAEFNALPTPLHIMTDIETLGLEVPSLVMEVAFLPFKFGRGEEEGHGVVSLFIPERLAGLTVLPPILEQMQNGTVIDPETVAWWLRQGNEARERMAAILDGATTERRSPIRSYLQDVGVCLASHGVDLKDEHSCSLWAKPASFDIPHLEKLWKLAGVRFPFHHRAKKCARTYCLNRNPPPHVRDEWKRSLTQHTAMDDCQLQIMEMAWAWGIKAGIIPKHLTKENSL